MSWIATVTSKTIIKGIYEVTVEYSDGVKIFNETYRHSEPPIDWIPETVRKRIKALLLVDAFSISIGVVTPSTDPVIDSDLAIFMRRIRFLAEVAEPLVSLGVIPIDNIKLQAVITWVRNHFDEYVDTF